MRIFKHPSQDQWSEFLKRPSFSTSEISSEVEAVINTVITNGDKALYEFSKKYYGVNLSDLRVSQEEMDASDEFVSVELKDAIKVAYKNILTFHTTHRENYHVVETVPGVRCWRRALPIEKVGLYIPAGPNPMFSDVLMLGVPAKLMGCKEIVVCVPTQEDGSVHPTILYAAKVVGLKSLFKLSGAHAIAAMAYGTESVPKVFKIFGQGNLNVAAAKQMVSRDGVAIDMPAGPSELMIVADDTMPASFVAADLISQAEHGIYSQLSLITFKEDYLKRVQKHVAEQLKEIAANENIDKALENCFAVIVKSQEEAISIVNEYAPEQLMVGLRNCNAFATEIFNAATIYLGNYSPESVGNYAAGPNHTLPKGGFSKMFSGIMLESFAKKVTYQQLTAEGLENIAPTVEVMAKNEGLEAHSQAVSLRLAYIKEKEKEIKMN